MARDRWAFGTSTEVVSFLREGKALYDYAESVVGLLEQHLWFQVQVRADEGNQFEDAVVENGSDVTPVRRFALDVV